MKLALQSFTTLVQNMAATVQSTTSQTLDIAVGSVTRAILESSASIALWLQWLLLQVLQSTRAATSVGPDLDSWMADFTLARLPAVAATGALTFSRITPVLQAVLPPGTLARTGDGTQTFIVSADATNPAWNPSLGGYVLPVGTASLTVPATAQAPGSAGNVQTSSITMLASAVPGIDAVSNASPFTNGLDAEADPAFRSRFQNFIQSRSRATPQAVAYAVASIQQGLRYAVQENISTAGTPIMGSFVVTVDDGSGNPSPALLSSVRAAVDAVRPVGSVFAVMPPTVVPTAITLSIDTLIPTSAASTTANVVGALASLVAQLPMGGVLPLSRLAQVTYTADQNVSNVTAMTINGVAADLILPPTAVATVSAITVTPL